jgi:hypothetical protein
MSEPNPLNPSDLDTADAAIEVVILWGELSILYIAHLAPPRAFYVGDAVDATGKPATDFLIGSESLGVERLPIVVEHGTRSAIVIPAGAVGEVTIHDQVITFEELAENQQLLAAAEPAGARPPRPSHHQVHHRANRRSPDSSHRKLGPRQHPSRTMHRPSSTPLDLPSPGRRRRSDSQLPLRPQPNSQLNVDPH